MKYASSSAILDNSNFQTATPLQQQRVLRGLLNPNKEMGMAHNDLIIIRQLPLGNTDPIHLSLIHI